MYGDGIPGSCGKRPFPPVISSPARRASIRRGDIPRQPVALSSARRGVAAARISPAVFSGYSAAMRMAVVPPIDHAASTALPRRPRM